MAANWTTEQQLAIDTRGCNLLVAAAAGAGKTAVLVERIIKMITDEENPVDIDRLLIVTFTNAAAAEMRERIGAAIEDVLSKNPYQRELQRQLTLLNKATITTIHSFCLEVIRNNFHMIDLDPGFRIANETETALLKLESLEEVFEEKYQDKDDENFFNLIECYGGSKDDLGLQEMVLSIYDFIQSDPWPKDWLKRHSDSFDVKTDFDDTLWAKILLEDARIELLGLARSMEEALSTIETAQGLGVYSNNFGSELNQIQYALSQQPKGWDNFREALFAITFERIPSISKKQVVDTDSQDKVKAIRDAVKDRLKKMKDGVFELGSQEILEDLKRLHPLMVSLSNLVSLLSDRYQSKKRQKSLVDFNDLEHYCLEILITKDEEGSITPSKAAISLRDKFYEILVDEYQDSNMVQEVMLRSISKQDSDNPNIFMVGDVKQSIYRFRQAKPELFMDKYTTYSEDVSRERKITLYKNFRSRREVVEGANYIFKQIMSKTIGELDYTDREALNPGAIFEDCQDEDKIIAGPAEFHLIEKNENMEAITSYQEATEGEEGEEDLASDFDEERLDNIQLEARVIGKRIKELMGPDDSGKYYCIWDKGAQKYRPLQFKDIVILLRATRNWAQVFVEELGAMGIPVYADTGTGYFKTTEVNTMLSLLQVIDNPMQDIPMLSVLRSPIGNFTPEELIDIRMVSKEISFWEAMEICAEGKDELALKTKSFLSDLKRWRKKALHFATDQLIWYLYGETGYYSYAGTMPGGVLRQANLKMLFERARQYEETSYRGLFNFVNFINRLKSSSGDMGSAKILGENEDVVRIMSIHKSKGLEFPVVFVSGCGKQFNMMDLNKSMILHQDMGFGPHFVDFERRISYSTVAKESLKKKIRLESLSEEMRVLYVAFTRAKEKLIITGTVKDIKKTCQNWSKTVKYPSEKVSDYHVLTGKSYMDWIGSALIRHSGCQNLRDLAEVEDYEMKSACIDESQWSIRQWDRSGLERVKEEEQGHMDQFKEKLQRLEDPQELGQYYQEIDKRLSWQYQHKDFTTLPTKLTVTELKRIFQAKDTDGQEAVYLPKIISAPRFMEGTQRFSSAQIGTILHFVMQHLDFYRTSSLEEIKAQIDDMISRELLTPEQASVVDVSKIEGFVRSNLGQRMLKAQRINREVPFNIEVRCSEVYGDQLKEIEDDYSLLLQGIIDLYFKEEDDIILVDYKTDYVQDNNIDIIKQRYKMQLDYYAKALEKITGKRVKERYIYLFSIGQVIEM